MSEDFKILSDRDHVRLRANMYLGSLTVEKQEYISFSTVNEFHVVPGLLKMVEEIYQNSVDEAIRTKFKHATKIDITFGEDSEGQFVQIEDNGRGIPVETTDEGWRPVLSWTRARAGTSFGADRDTIGANGVGSFLTVVFSKKFIGETSDGKKSLKLIAEDGMSSQRHIIDEPWPKNGTRVKFYPDISLFSGVDSLTTDHVRLVEHHVSQLSICYPQIKFTVNGKVFQFKNNKELVSRYHEKAVSYSNNINGDVLCIFAPKPEKLDGFQSISYINGINMKNGGNHIGWFVGHVVEELRPMIKKKWKIEVPPSQIMSGLLFACYLSGFKNMKFDGQTKERLTNTHGEISQFFSMDQEEFKKLAKQIVSTDEIILPIIDAILRKKELEDAREAAKKAKLAKKIKVVNHIEAQSDNPAEKMLFISEGHSAAGPLISVRNAMTVGGYCLRGKVMNTYGMKAVDILKNKEYFELCAVLGLTLGAGIEDLTYHKICFLTDMDTDGDSIYASLLLFFSNWPELFERGHIYRAKSPLYVCKKKKDVKRFFTHEEYMNANLGTGWEINYIKGLGSLDQEDYSDVVNDPKLVRIGKLTEEDIASLTMAFGDHAGPRKEWMMRSDDF